MKYLKVFNTDSEYQTFKDGDNYVTPNICLINNNNTVRLAPTPILAGDVAYWNGSKVKTTPYSNWNESLGTPVGVVVVPKGFAPDGKVRIIGLNPVDADGNQSSSHIGMDWNVAGTNTDTSLTNYTRVPTTDNTGSASTGSANHGYLPSDKFTEITSYVDSKANYIQDVYMIPSPYLGDKPNPEYYKVLEGNNVLSDFNGLSNTETLIGSATTYIAANAAWNYNDGSSGLQWYLPGMGELGHIMPRFNEINATITALGGLAVASRGGFWSSSECSSYYAHGMDTINGSIYDDDSKTYNFYVRPFAIID